MLEKTRKMLPDVLKQRDAANCILRSNLASHWQLNCHVPTAFACIHCRELRHLQIHQQLTKCMKTGLGVHASKVGTPGCWFFSNQAFGRGSGEVGTNVVHWPLNLRLAQPDQLVWLAWLGLFAGRQPANAGCRPACAMCRCMCGYTAASQNKPGSA